MKIYGHRGCKGTFPENTLLGFRKAIQAGVDGIELDVHLTEDGEIVVIHDETLDRTTTGQGAVKELTLSQIQTFSAGAPFREFTGYEPSWDDEKVPTLRQVLELIADTKIELNIELKGKLFPYPHLEEKLLKLVGEFGMNDRVIYSSFHYPYLKRLKKQDPAAKIAALFETKIPMPAFLFKHFHLEGLHLSWKSVLEHPQHWSGLYGKIRVWTVNEEKVAAQLQGLGVAAIITDFPDKIFSALEK